MFGSGCPSASGSLLVVLWLSVADRRTNMPNESCLSVQGTGQPREADPILALSKTDPRFTRPIGRSWKREQFSIRAGEITTVPDWWLQFYAFAQLVKRDEIVLVGGASARDTGSVKSRRIVSRTGAMFQRRIPHSNGTTRTRFQALRIFS
jgi:hypothetical protein